MPVLAPSEDLFLVPAGTVLTTPTIFPFLQFTNDTEEIDLIVIVTAYSGGGSMTLLLETDQGIVGGTQQVFRAQSTGLAINATGTFEFRVALGGVPGGGTVRANVTAFTGTSITFGVQAQEVRNGQPPSV